jgi:hypothetical protein
MTEKNGTPGAERQRREVYHWANADG